MKPATLRHRRRQDRLPLFLSHSAPGPLCAADSQRGRRLALRFPAGPARQAAGPPAVASTEPVAHWVAARRRGTCLAARTIRAKGDYRSSAAITVLFAQALTRPAPPPRAGVLFPEEVVTLDDIRPGLAGAGIT